MSSRGRRAASGVWALAPALVAGSLLWGCGSSDDAPGDSPGASGGGAAVAPGAGGNLGTGGAATSGAPAPFTVPDGATSAQACRDYFEAVCARLNECDPSWGNSCLARADLCPDRLIGAGSSWTIESAYSCAAKWKSASCEELAQGDPVCDKLAGQLPPGDACLFHSQCTSGSCSSQFEPTASCGTCDRAAQPGESCGAPGVTCPPGEFCIDGSCRKRRLDEAPWINPPGLGEVCTPMRSCTDGLVCQTATAGSEATEGVCVVAPKIGEPCAPSFSSSGKCEPEGTCNARPTGTCVKRPIAGESCGFTSCDADSFCNVGGQLPEEPTHFCYSKLAAGADCHHSTFGVDQGDCLSGLQCLCVDTGCNVSHCASARNLGESCNDQTEICQRGFRCTDGTCTSVEDAGWIDAICQ